MILSSISVYSILVTVIAILLVYQLRQFLLAQQNEKESQLKLLESENKFRLAFDSSPIGIGLLSLEGRWLEVNKALCAILGYPEEELLQLNFQHIIHPEDYIEDQNFIKELDASTIPYYQIEERLIKSDRQPTWVSLTRSVIRDDEGAPLHYIIQIQDVNDKRKTENELSYKAYYDSLTGLFNRNQLEHSLETSISSALRHQKKFAVFFIDLDHFKNINDRMGHDTGDDLLKIVGERLKHNIRQTDIAARLGGDEFILVLNGISNPETAAIFAEKVIDILIKPIKIKEHELFITTSIGISFYPADGIDFNSLIKSADLALYKAKESGRNNYQFCTPEMNNEIKEKINFKNALQTALDNHEFHLVYLPKLDLKKNSITGFEALLRWKNEKYGDVPPNKIIPLADEMGIISQLSKWIIKTAIEKTKIWQQYGLSQPTKISINISARHFTEDNFVENILKALNTSRLAPDYLQLEINENLIMRDPDYSLKIIHQLKNVGIQVVIDNFGTGYSSLSFLQQFAVDYIKIDRNFIQDIQADDKKVLFLSAIVDLAKNLGIKTLAEGVESREQIDLLTRIGCDEIQGFYISPPIEADKVPYFLETQAKKTGIIHQ